MEMSSYVEDVTDDQLADASSNMRVTSDASVLAEADCISIVYLRQPLVRILTYVPSWALKDISGYVMPEVVVVIESTVYPNFTKEKAAPLFPHAHVVFSPERVIPNSDYSIENIPKVIGADTPEAAKAQPATTARCLL